MENRTNWWAVLAIIAAWDAQAQEVITTIDVVEKANLAATAYPAKSVPLTFGLPLPAETVRKNTETVEIWLNGASLVTQFDAKAGWNGTHVKHGIVSVIVPSLERGGRLRLEVRKKAAVPPSTGFLTQEQLKAEDFRSEIALEGLTGSGLSGNAAASLKTCLEGPYTYWLKGPVVTEVLCSQRINRSLGAEWELRHYPAAAGKARVSTSVENTFLQYLGTIDYGVKISVGKGTASQVYSKTAFSHTYSSRWRKTFWIGGEPPEVEIRYDLPYLIKTGLVPPYGLGIKVAEAKLASEWTRWQTLDTDIGGTGNITKYFPTTGGRDDIGILPTWTARYLLTMDNRMKKIMLGNGEMAAHIDIHLRESDSSLKSFGRPVSVIDRPDIDAGAFWEGHGRYGGPVFVGERKTNGWSADRAHQGSFAYVPYLVTGEWYFLQELYYWAASNIAIDNYKRERDRGIMYDQYRGRAWSMRTLGHAASMAPDGTPEQEYFQKMLANNIQYDVDMNLGSTGHGLHVYVGATTNGANMTGFSKIMAPWQHDFILLTYADLERHGFARAKEVRDHLARFTIDRFTMEPDFPRLCGAGYWWPFDKADGTLYKAGEWGQYWADVKRYENKASAYVPSTNDLLKYDYPYSYAYIARAALASVTHLERGKAAYDFLGNTLSTAAKLNEDPTWGLVSKDDGKLNVVSVGRPAGDRPASGKVLSLSRRDEFSPTWHGQLRFSGAPPRARLYISTASGAVVKAFDACGPEGEFVWDGSGDDGSRLTPGRYLFLLRGPSGAKLDSGNIRLAK